MKRTITGKVDQGKEIAGIIVLAIFVLVAVYYGWRLFWFLTDDAFITFRYVSNSLLGHGYVWNPPPFRPVEGYSSFLWVVLLDIVWRLLGVQPPDSANYLSLIFSYLTLLLGALMLLKAYWNEACKKYRVLFLSLALIGVITNRTFLAWTSSGLETAAFNFTITLWVFCTIFLPAYSKQWLFGISFAAMLVYLTRPDGILFAAATACMILIGAYQHRYALSSYTATTPLLVIPIHLFWRKATYGEWLPNTYYAKTIPGRFWIESGARYFLSFVIEYALWFWLFLLGALIVRELLSIKATRMPRLNLSSPIGFSPIKMIVVTTLLVHFLYYTVKIGGDHFEFRVYSHLVLLLFVSFPLLANRLNLNAKLTGLWLSSFIIVSWIIPWTHWSITHQLTTRKETGHLRVSVSQAIHKTLPIIPDFIEEYLEFYDGMQYWLIGHAVCMRHQEHKVFHLVTVEALPSREIGMSLPSDNYPVLTQGSVGILSWVFPKINVIDTLGLNDYVIARNPDVRLGSMAHERTAPPGYIDCFMPNVEVHSKDIIIPRATELTADAIIHCEQYYADMVTK